MSSTIELQESLKILPQKIIDAAKQQLKKLADDSRELLQNSQLLSAEASETAQKLDQYSSISIYKNPYFIAPLIAVVLIVIVSNVVFIRADKYSASIVTIVLQASFFAVAVGSLISGYSAMRKQKYAFALANQEFKLEEEIDKSQSEFISNTSVRLSKDVASISALVSMLKNHMVIL
jgi:hypothetical protein